MMESSFFRDKLYYLQTNPMRSSDLRLANIEDNTVIVMTGGQDNSLEKSDVVALFITQIIRQNFPFCKIFTQINLA